MINNKDAFGGRNNDESLCPYFNVIRGLEVKNGHYKEP